MCKAVRNKTMLHIQRRNERMENEESALRIIQIDPVAQLSIVATGVMDKIKDDPDEIHANRQKNIPRFFSKPMLLVKNNKATARVMDPTAKEYL